MYLIVRFPIDQYLSVAMDKSLKHNAVCQKLINSLELYIHV